MEKVSLEQIDLIMQRANVSYSEAKEALEACNGDMLEAIISLEKAEKIKANKKQCTDAGNTIKNFINKLNATRFILHKEDHIYINVSLTLAIIALVFCFHISIIALIIALCNGVRVKVTGENDIAEKINSGLDFIKK